MNVDVLDAGLGDGPSAHDPLPDPDLTAPADLDDAVRSDNPAVVHDPEAPHDQTIVGAVDEAIPANDLIDGLAPDDATIVGDDVPLNEEEQEEQETGAPGQVEGHGA